MRWNVMPSYDFSTSNTLLFISADVVQGRLIFGPEIWPLRTSNVFILPGTPKPYATKPVSKIPDKVYPVPNVLFTASIILIVAGPSGWALVGVTLLMLEGSFIIWILS